MNAANQRQLTPILAALAVLLAALFLLLLAGVGRGVHWDDARALPPLPPAGNGGSLPQPQPLSQFAVVWQKPLFSPDRKPMASEAAGNSNLGDLQLSGIILTGGLRMALLHDKNGDQQLRLREGESTPDGSITLVEVRPRSAVFDSSSGRTELKLPAGAPIDKLPSKDEASRDAGQQHADDGNERNPMLHPQPMRAPSMQPQPPTPIPQSAVERLKENIQKRRAARAAAAHEGVL